MDEVKLINLTPHSVNIVDLAGETILSIEQDGLSRCSVSRFRAFTIPYNNLDIRVNKTQFGQVSGLPEPEEGTFYVVSRPVAEAMKNKRSDLLVADEIVRKEGKIIGCRSLALIND